MRFGLVDRRQHLLHAALVWTAMGMVLGIRGLAWTLGDVHWFHIAWPGLALMAVVGCVKGWWVLRPAAGRLTSRIRASADRTPVWTLFTPLDYLMILAMVGFGMLCRWVGRSWHVFGLVGLLYVAVAVALLVGSSDYWRAWRRCC